MKDVKERLEKFLSVIITCAMAMMMVPISARADDVETVTVSYIDADGTLQPPRECTKITATTTEWTQDGADPAWYAVTESVTISSRVTVKGNVKLILADNCKLTVECGIRLAATNTLAIYAQSLGERAGVMTAKDAEGVGQSIGGNDATGADVGEDSGDVTINGGRITEGSIACGGKGTQGNVTGGAGGNLTIWNGFASGRMASAGDTYNAWGMTGAPAGTLTVYNGRVQSGAICTGGAAMNTGRSGTARVYGGVVTAGYLGNNYRGGGAAALTTTRVVGATKTYGSPVIIVETGGVQGGPDLDEVTGVLFLGSTHTGRIYTENGVHTNVTPTTDFDIPTGYTLTIDDGTTLTVAEGVTMTVGGTVQVAVDGELAGDGALQPAKGSELIKYENPKLNGANNLAYTSADLTGGISVQTYDNNETVSIMGQNFDLQLASSWAEENLTIEYYQGQQSVTGIKYAGDYEAKITDGTNTVTQSISVAPARLSATVTVQNGKRVDDNDETTTVIKSSTLDGVLGADDVSLSISGVTFTEDNQARYEGIALTGTDARNYTLAESDIVANIINIGDALDEIQKAADAKNKEIEESTTLTEDEKAKLEQNVADEVAKATAAINDADSNDEVQAAKEAGVTAIEGIKVPVTEPENPTDPDKSDGTEKPDSSNKPDGTDKPDGSNKPGDTNKPVNPDDNEQPPRIPDEDVVDPKESWGELIYRADIPHYVSADGTTSVEVTSYGMIWLKEESDGTSAWYGLDNSSGEFAIGSRFHVHWLSKKSDPDEWDKYYAQLDKEHKDAVENNNLWIFLIGATHPDGTEHTKFSRNVPLYIQLGDDWDKDDINAVFISAGEDEVLDVTYSDGVVYPEGTDTFAKLTLNHFSPYAVYDKLAEAKKAAKVSSNDAKSTGDIVSIYLTSFFITTILLAAAYILIKRQKCSE